ncbi:MAG: fumarate hydratase C-terminal domain-containing protein [Theionarchaea archaeon]|nr:fumarate hydratase C-terminal domain-containing protein [Theionarchaea archaeon]MBU7001033.1 fumarate hydratase C-terminal domain-containing protein [Theionarchaea archaeon]MBU7020522.1 fumarate hydratase C-terminal domain-containing protein [Theionarchaea archaeon]MBU7034210.1 fumarate hydratase C-terminal domain-containing protein [Theionarchaea archaeon]MBU7039816.1 fumarate hydratase C-terminal domain-containing protein [Theionarchaea archaeon]
MKTLSIPLTEKDVRELKLGETVYLNGEFYTARDEAHMTALEYAREKTPLPVDFKDKAVFHCGPIMRKLNGTWELVAAGPTTSTRMNSLEPEFIRTFGPRAIIGKGGMGKETSDAMKEYGCVYLAITGGAAVLAAKGIKKVKGVEWLELGMPEAVWILEGEGFGPLIVAMDAQGNSLFENVEKQVKENAQKIRKTLGLV